MTTLTLYRHRQSAANAGEATAALPVATDAQVLLLGHGQFMQALRWGLIDCPELLLRDLFTPELIDRQAMLTFQQLEHTMPIANASALSCLYLEGKWLMLPEQSPPL